MVLTGFLSKSPVFCLSATRVAFGYFDYMYIDEE